MSESSIQRVWTLAPSGLVVTRGDLVEYHPELSEQKLAAMVVSVSTVGYAGYGSRYPVGTQIIAARKITNRRLPHPEELADTQIAATLVTRKLSRKGEAIPLPTPVAKTSYSPFADDNPWRVDTYMTPEEWKEIARWYAYSLRSLVFDGSWHEIGRYGVRDTAYHIMKMLAEAPGNAEKRYVLIQCSLQGKEGREKAVYCYPGSEQTILAERQKRLAERKS